jgi:hypothetical protein
VVVGCENVTGIPYLIDVDIGDIAAVVGFVEGYAVWNMGGGFYLDHGKDCRVVMAAQRGVFHTEQPGEAGSGNSEAFPIPEIKRDFFESEADDVSVGECERIIAAIVCGLIRTSDSVPSSSWTRSGLARIATSWSRRRRKMAKQSPDELEANRTAGLRRLWCRTRRSQGTGLWRGGSTVTRHARACGSRTGGQ